MSDPTTAPPVDIFDVRMGNCPNHDQAFGSLNRSGSIRISSAFITVSGERKTGDGTGAMMFGAVGVLVSAAVAAARSKELQIQIDPKATTAFCDPKRRVVSLELSDGTWLAITPKQALLRKGQAVFDYFVAVLEASIGQTAQAADLGKMGQGRKKLLKVLLAVMIALFILGIVAFALFSAGVGRR